MRPADSPSASSTTLIDDSTSHDRPFTHECAPRISLTDQSTRDRHGGKFDRRKRKSKVDSSAADSAAAAEIEMTEFYSHVHEIIAPSQRATWRASMSRALWHNTEMQDGVKHFLAVRSQLSLIHFTMVVFGAALWSTVPP